MVDFTQDLLSAGLSYEDIRARLRRGELVRLRRGLYRAAGLPPLAGNEIEDPEARGHLEAAAAAMLQLRPGACLSHVTAGVLHRLPVPRHLLGRVHITRPGRGGKTWKGIQLHRALLPPEHRMESGIGPVTSPTRTTADLLRMLAPAAALACADAALKAGVDRAEALDLLTGARLSNSVLARQIMRLADPASESVGESHSRWLLHSLGLPAPVLQHAFLNAHGEFVARTDFWWPQYRMVGEFDGETKYGRLLKPGQTIEQVVNAERRRENALRRLGVWVVRWAWSDLDDPEQFRALVLEGFRFAAKTQGH